MTQDNDTALWHRTIWAAALLAVVLVVTACSTGSQGPGVANAGTTSQTTAAGSSGSGSSGSSASSNRSTELKYSQCMRAHGIADFPDPGSNGISISGGPGSDLNPNNPTFQAASRACQKYSPGAHMTPAQKAQAQAALLKFAQCMRAHGIADFPDPSSGPNGGVGFQIRSGPGSDLDPHNPINEAAQRACQADLPGGKKGNGGLQIGSVGGGKS